MKKNVGILDAHLRIAFGLTLLGLGILKKSLCYIILGSCKVSEGITRFCPVLYMLNYSTCECDRKSEAPAEELKNEIEI